MVMTLFLLLVLFFVTAHGFMNCSTTQKHVLSRSSSDFINTALLDQIVVLTADNSVSKDLVWRGNRNGLDISLYESESATQSMQMRPTMQGPKVSLEIVLKKMRGGSFHDIKEKIQTAFDAGTVSQECQVPAAIQSYAASTGNDNIPNWMKCFACATVLGFTVPVVLNIAIGDLFTAWCVSQGQSEEQCEVWSMDVVLASEGAIVLIGGAIVYEVCFSGGKCESQLEANNMLKL